MAKTASKISTTYDETADVLHVGFGTGEPSYSETVDGVLQFEVEMYTHLPTGFQIIGFKKHDKDLNFALVEKVGRELLRSGTKHFKHEGPELEHLLHSARNRVQKLMAA